MVDPRALFAAAVDAVRGDHAVARFLGNTRVSRPDQIIAIGKAASAMAKAACAHFDHPPCLVITKYGHGAGTPDHAELIEAAHPIPDGQSLLAGHRALETVASLPPQSHLLLLVSGGASALAEALPPDMTLGQLRDKAQKMLGEGLDIHTINAARKAQSLIKGGGLLARFSGAQVTALAISDVEGDDLGTIGSGIGCAPAGHRFGYAAHIIASNAHARSAAAAAAVALGAKVMHNAETLYDDIHQIAPIISRRLIAGQKGVYIWGGEPTVILPRAPGLGGRNQALGALLARELAGHKDICVLVAGTDGTDGPTDAAGALINGTTWSADGFDALDRADTYPWLAHKDALFRCGPTGTNVMDLVIAVRP
jgi:hydroxypyruvate reductase